MISSSDTTSAIHFCSSAFHRIGSKYAIVYVSSITNSTNIYLRRPAKHRVKQAGQSRARLSVNLHHWGASIYHLPTLISYSSQSKRKENRHKLGSIQFLQLRAFEASLRPNNFAYLTTAHSPEC